MKTTDFAAVNAYYHDNWFFRLIQGMGFDLNAYFDNTFFPDVNNIFEIHAGYTDPVVRDKNIPIASTVASWAACVGGLQPAQIYKGISVYTGAPDRNLFDPAINRSDHAAFHQQGFPTVAVTEDYFANLVTEPAKDPNPHYHTADDTFVDADYGASIAAAIACAVKALAA